MRRPEDRADGARAGVAGAPEKGPIVPRPNRRHVSLVAVPDAIVSTLAGLFDVMNGVAMTGNAAPFLVEIVGDLLRQKLGHHGV